VIQRYETGRMIELATWIGGAFVNSHGGDGLVIATPTGSTAYALSCGGPIMHPHLDAVVIAPISPHTLSDRPIVVRRDCEIEVRLNGRATSRAQVTFDGAALGDLERGQPADRRPGARDRHPAAPARPRLLPHPALQAALGPQRPRDRTTEPDPCSCTCRSATSRSSTAVELELAGGLTALTGETGAGKSILVDAVMLAIGGRGAADVVRHGAARAEIAATFDVAGNEAARGWLEAQSLDAE
jgi:hypothetical protein